MYHPGALDQLIQIKKRVATDDGYGGEDFTVTNLCRAWALVKPLSGGERLKHDRLLDTTRYMFVIRYRGDITEEMFIEWNGQTFEVRNIMDKGGRRLYLEIEAERNAN